MRSASSSSLTLLLFALWGCKSPGAARNLGVAASAHERAPTVMANPPPADAAPPPRVRGSYVPLTLAANGIDGRLETWTLTYYAGTENEAHERWCDYAYGKEGPQTTPLSAPQWARLVLVDEAGAVREGEDLGEGVARRGIYDSRA